VKWPVADAGFSCIDSRLLFRLLNENGEPSVTVQDNAMGRTRIDNSTYVLDKFRSLGIDPSGRFTEMHKALSGGIVPYDENDPIFRAAAEAEKDMQQLGFIFDQAGDRRNDPVFMKLMNDVVLDSVDPQKDCPNSPGRDAQFNLFLAAVCQRARMLPVGYGGADVTCKINGKLFGIEAKRIKSPKQARARITKAADQIKKSGMHGIIAVEHSLAWNSENRPIVSGLESAAHVLLGRQRCTSFFDKHKKRINEVVAGCGVVGIVVFNFYVRHRPDREWEMDVLE
jgi:hypothetical protein